MVKRNNLVFKETNRGLRKEKRIDKEITAANRQPITNIRRKRQLLKREENG